MESLFAFEMSRPARPAAIRLEGGYDPDRQQVAWDAGDAGLYATCTRSYWGWYWDCQSDGIQCWDGGGGSWTQYECDFL